MADDSIEAEELERAADWRLRKVGEDPTDAHSAAAAKLLQKLADDVRGLRGSPAHTRPTFGPSGSRPCQRDRQSGGTLRYGSDAGMLSSAVPIRCGRLIVRHQ